MRPTGRLHLGHYFSNIVPGLNGAAVLIANYHAPEEQNTEQIIQLLRKFGVTDIRLQRDVYNAELYFQLLSIASIGDLARMTQYKAAEEATRTAQLLTYPVLMAHDVAGFQEILVGIDQQQHLEYAAKLLKKYNRKFDANYTIPKANIVVGRVKDLREPSKKMSKSSPQGCLFLDDSADEIKSKLRKAVMTDEGRENLVFLYGEFVGGEVPESNLTLKDQLAEALLKKFTF